MVYIDAEVMREGKDQTLDNLNVGVVILDKNDMKIRYYNKAASVFSDRNLNSSTINQNEPKPDYTSFVKEHEQKVFAIIDKNDLKLSQVADVEATTKKIKDTDDYKSL